MFMLISQLNRRISQDVPFVQRVESIGRELYSSREAFSIREKRRVERTHSEVARWTVVAANGACLRYDYEWLKPLQPSVDYIVDFGCWASDARTGTCSEPYALLWTLEAAKVVVVDKEPEYIQNAQIWLETTREQHPYFRNYNLVFVVGDMTHKGLAETTDALEENGFDLSYCHNVLYNMYPSPTALQDSVSIMASVVKPGGWVIAIEPKMGVEHEQKPCDLFGGRLSIPVPLGECKDIGQYFEVAGLVKFNLDGAPECSYCYQKPQG
jgi:SAM-dependent methyltransferase